MLVTKDERLEPLLQVQLQHACQGQTIVTIFRRVTSAAYHGEDCSICGHSLKSPGLSTKISHGFRLPLITLENWPSSRTHTVSGIPGHFWLSCLLSFYFCAFPPSIWPYMVACFLSFHNPSPVTKTSTNSESHARPSSKTDQVCKSPSHRDIQRMQKEPGTEWLLWYR